MIYVDNGAIYSSIHFVRICARLGTFVDQSFVPEAYDLIEQGKIQTL
ncbi:hypothetical protein BBR01nite_61660 [Brevibacillus brevis]|nr:hypothetical protein [Brevibacillus brevis]GEC93835.1 hypothetical protein BBR01nite_61660 [Brevibacillus brevis]